MLYHALLVAGLLLGNYMFLLLLGLMWLAATRQRRVAISWPLAVLSWTFFICLGADLW